MALKMNSLCKVAPSTRPSTVTRAAPARDSERAMVPPFAGATIAIASFLTTAQLSYAGIPDKMKLPPIPNDPTRCEKLAAALIGETSGKKLNKPQATSAVDMRKCSFHEADLRGKALAGALIVESDMSGANLREAVLTKAFAMNADFSNADMTSAVVNGVDFEGANLRGASLNNAVITGTNFNNVDLTGVNFEDALVSQQDQKRICANETLQGESREQIGCRS
ncbi:hypothetical protein DUNSADRAFT_5503 [Dunaliella salina]|uniref:Uncharacterized protein n=1 Tax=Dunaliella salina TaxID=3046 RepID=A0ABQ7H7B0_DUNSA|nr:hypothetical protein DUNSADRAFT_5503 [Dunaliella salina]|eukprot:KAF5842736.1 hypothetical protein DUNSADRAFT_5503 [Dunaliella salina]